MKIEITKKNERSVTVSVSIPRRKYATDPYVHVDASDIRRFLSNNEPSYTECVKDTVLTNYTSNPKLSGDWVFLSPVSQKPTKKPKVEVPVEQPEAPTDLENNESESNNEQPTTKRRRRRRTPAKTKD